MARRSSLRVALLTVAAVALGACTAFDQTQVLGSLPGSEGGGAGASGGQGGSGSGGASGGAGAGPAGGASGASGACCAQLDDFGTTWRPLRLGGGGLVAGLDIAPDGTKVVRNASYGAHLWRGDRWSQLVTAASLPAAYAAIERNAGVYELRIAPGDSQRLYMTYLGAVFRSDNQGATWAKTAFPIVTASDPAGDHRAAGQKMAVDPANPDVVYAGTSDQGLWATTDGGQSWSAVVGVPAAVGGGIHGIAFDPSAGADGGRTRTIYAGSWGQGVFASTDAGATWSRPPGGPTGVTHGTASAGRYFATGDGKVWRYQGGAWQDISPSVGDWATVLVDPLSPQRVVVASGGGGLTLSLDGGDSWTGLGDTSRAATDVPWLAWVEHDYMPACDLAFDPATPDRIWFAEGLGVWTTDLVGTPSSVAYTSRSAGLEQMAANQVTSPPGGKPVVASWHQPLFRVDDPDVYPTRYGPDGLPPLQAAWSVDWASSDPSFLVALINLGGERSSYSTDGGVTWTPFASHPPYFDQGKIGGNLAASTPQNIVWFPANRGLPSYTQDGGASWQPCVFPDAPPDDDPGWNYAYFLRRHIVAADRVEAGTFYAYNYLRGLYRSQDGAASWQLVKAGELNSFSQFNAKLRAVPGRAGHLFFSSGHSATDTNPDPNVRLHHSTDGGVTWTAIEGLAEVYDFGFGQARAEGGYPALFVAGWVGGTYGIHRSDDEGATWKQVGDWPLGSLDMVAAVAGDMNVAGRVIVGFTGSGYVVGDTAP